jgi:hypothetical protein
MTQTAVDKFHDAVNDMIARRRPMTSNEVAKIWLECKEIEKEQIIEAFKHGKLPPLFINFDAEQYYNNEYGK